MPDGMTCSLCLHALYVYFYDNINCLMNWSIFPSVDIWAVCSCARFQRVGAKVSAGLVNGVLPDVEHAIVVCRYGPTSDGRFDYNLTP